MITESKHQPVVGIWSTTQRKNAQGYYTQVSRLGNPLVNEVVNPLKDKDKLNASSPWNDGQFLKNVTNPELPKLMEASYKIKTPAEPRKSRRRLPQRCQGPQPAAERATGGDAAPEHLGQAGRRAETARCARR
jgi:hypothetical protein